MPGTRVCLAAAIILLACAGLAGQTFEVGPQGNQPANGRKDEKSSRRGPASDSGMGWGSSIAVAREARAAREALQRNDYRTAASHAERAAKAAPQNPDFWFLFAYASRLAGQYSESVDAYQKGLQGRPNSIEGLSGLAQTYAKMGRGKDAEEILKRVIAANPTSDADLRLAGELILTSDPKVALSYLERADSIHPSARNELLMARACQ